MNSVGNSQVTSPDEKKYFLKLTFPNLLIDKYGYPDALAPQKGGIAIWNESIQDIIDPIFGQGTIKNIFSITELRHKKLYTNVPICDTR